MVLKLDFDKNAGPLPAQIILYFCGVYFRTSMKWIKTLQTNVDSARAPTCLCWLVIQLLSLASVFCNRTHRSKTSTCKLTSRVSYFWTITFIVWPCSSLCSHLFLGNIRVMVSSLRWHSSTLLVFLAASALNQMSSRFIFPNSCNVKQIKAGMYHRGSSTQHSPSCSRTFPPSLCISDPGFRWSFSTSLSWPTGSMPCRSSTSRKYARSVRRPWEPEEYWSVTRKALCVLACVCSACMCIWQMMRQNKKNSWSWKKTFLNKSLLVFQEEISRQLQYICLYLLHISAAYLLK